MGIGYDALWLRDYEYTLEGSVEAYTTVELIDACRLFIRSMRDDGAGVDCVRFNGVPVYRPGYDSMGEHPVADGSQFTVGVAFHTWSRARDAVLLSEVLDPLLRTMAAVPRRSDDGLVFIDPGHDWDRCPYGFTDTVRKSGAVLFSSLLYVQACRQLSEMLEAAGRNAESHRWRAQAERVGSSVRRIFWYPDVGLFRAATVRCREPDIWGSAFAVYLGVADGDQSLAVARSFRAQYDQIVQDGQIRHLPGGVYWEWAGPRDEYQNGGYWATPTPDARSADFPGYGVCRRPCLSFKSIRSVESSVVGFPTLGRSFRTGCSIRAWGPGFAVGSAPGCRPDAVRRPDPFGPSAPLASRAAPNCAE